MRGLIWRAAVVAGAVVVLGPAAGVASAGASGTVKLGWSPSDTFSFGGFNAGATSPPEAFKLTNSGTSGTGALKVTLTPASGTPASAFTKTADTCTGTSLGPNKSCSVSVAYTAPATPGSYQATLTAGSNKPAATASVTLVGVSKAFPAITTSPSGGPVGGKGEVTDTATLSNGISPAGTITFKLYGPSAAADCSTLVDTETATVSSGNGSYSTPFGYSPTQAGTYWWTASGDASNNPASSGCGAEQAAVSQATPAMITTPTPATATVGTTVNDTATLSDGYNPTGFITFALAGPFSPGATPDCSGPFASVENVTVNGNGSYTTAFGQTPDQPGIYYWTADYSGDTNNTFADTACGDEPVVISPASPAITTSPSPGVPTGVAVHDTATLSGGYNLTGTIGFKLYGPSATADCSGTAVDDETVTVNGNGSYTTAAGFTPTQAGTYWWTASYSGDTNNTTASAGCGAESVTIGRHLYWASNSPGTINEANLDGSNPQTLITDHGSPIGVAVDGSHIYWTDSGAGTINVANLDGSNPHPVLTRLGEPTGVTVDGSHIYWTDFGPAGAGTVNVANLDGSNPQTLATGQSNPYEVAVDGSHLYWTDSGGGTVNMANLDGSNPQTLATGQDDPRGVALDASHIYWTDFAGTINEANLDGSNPQTLVTGQFGAIAVAVDGSHIYWTNTPNGQLGSGTINGANLDGSNPQTLITGQNGPVGVAVSP
jgi:hypothetical protein